VNPIRIGKCGVSLLSDEGGRDAKRDLPYRAIARQLAADNKLRVPAFHKDGRALRKWPILGNDKWGCCTFAGIVRIIMNNAAKRGEFLDVQDRHVIKAYLDHTGGKDAGAMPINALNYMRNIGIKLDDGKVIKVDAFARVDNFSTYEWHSAIQTFGHLYVAAGLPAKLDDDRDDVLELSPPEKWTDRDEPASMGNHAYDIFGFQNNEQMAVLWDQDVTELQPWTIRYRREGWVILDNQEPDGYLRDVMMAQLDAIRA